MRRLILHMGLPKTGTTALQVWCVRNRGWLQQRGVWYPPFRSDARAMDGGSHVGNGIPLMRYLRPESATHADAPQRVLRQVRAELTRTDAKTVLYSNEWLFGQHRPEQLRALRDALAETGVTLQTVVYLRDIVGLALSAYAQQVQTRLVATTFGEYVGSSGALPPTFGIHWQATLERMLADVGPEHVVVRHYDSNRHRLVEDFLEVLRIGDRPDGAGDAASVYNRTLTVREIEWKRYLNARITTRAESRRLGAAISQLPAPSEGERLGATAADVAALRRFDHQVDWLNRTFFGGEPVLSILGALACVPEPQQPIHLTTAERRLLDVLLAEVAPESMARLGRVAT
jgi:hypothetical protein